MEAVVRLDGMVEGVLGELVDRGYFRTRSEALRAGVLKLGMEFDLIAHLQEVEEKMVAAKLSQEEGEMRRAKKKYLSESEALSKYR